jgi:hypothetical protein
MRHSSSTWRSRIVAALACAGLVVGAASAALAATRPWLCLPPIFDGGQRLMSLPAPRLFWLELLLRQHELCWRSPATPDELRVALVGSSAVYGFPNPVEHTLGHWLNRHFADAGIPARLYNVAFVNPSQVRDALIIHDVLPYQPDVIVYPMTLSEFQHVAPVLFPSVLSFFRRNRPSVTSLFDEAPPGLEYPISRWQWWAEHRVQTPWAMDAVREVGAFLHLAAVANAHWIVRQVHSDPPYVDPRKRVHVTDYKCEDVERNFEKNYHDWQDWNVLAYLQHLRETTGTEVLIVNWPVPYEPVGDCYNARFSKAAFAEFVAWLGGETAARGLPYLDLHAFLPPDAFADSIHLGADGHRRVAAEIARALDPILSALAERRRQSSAAAR